MQVSSLSLWDENSFGPLFGIVLCIEVPFNNGPTEVHFLNPLLNILYVECTRKYAELARRKFPLLKIHSTKSTSQISMIQIFVKSGKIEVFLLYFWMTYEH